MRVLFLLGLLINAVSNQQSDADECAVENSLVCLKRCEFSVDS